MQMKGTRNIKFQMIKQRSVVAVNVKQPQLLLNQQLRLLYLNI